jgi:hypothetical protein
MKTNKLESNTYSLIIAALFLIAQLVRVESQGVEGKYRTNRFHILLLRFLFFFFNYDMIVLQFQCFHTRRRASGILVIK